MLDIGISYHGSKRLSNNLREGGRQNPVKQNGFKHFPDVDKREIIFGRL